MVKKPGHQFSPYQGLNVFWRNKILLISESTYGRSASEPTKVSTTARR